MDRSRSQYETFVSCGGFNCPNSFSYDILLNILGHMCLSRFRKTNSRATILNELRIYVLGWCEYERMMVNSKAYADNNRSKMEFVGYPQCCVLHCKLKDTLNFYILLHKDYFSFRLKISDSNNLSKSTITARSTIVIEPIGRRYESQRKRWDQSSTSMESD